jgi:hypothetical protein
MALERRKHVRKLSYLGGRVAFNHLYSTMDCLIRNISPSGGRIVFGESMALPQHFVLSIPTREQSLNARVVWAKEKEAGIVFEALADKTPVSLDLARRIKQLEDDKQKLKRRIEQLTGEK